MASRSVVVFHSSANGSVYDVAGHEDRQHGEVVGGIERPLAQQADGLDHLLGRPGGAGVDDGAQLGPAVEQPSAAVGGGLEAQEESRGVVGVVGPAVGQAVEVGPDAEAADEVGHAGRRQEASTQVLDLRSSLLGGVGPERVGDQGVLDAVGAIEPPG
jgi:hypothetical protein